MPYICLATDNIPDGVLQVLDLWPNTSQRSRTIDPPGQTRYVNRVQNDPTAVNSVTGKATKAAHGLMAYLVSRVEPFGLDNATGTVTLANVDHGDTVTIAGVVFTATRNFATGTVTIANVQAGDTVTLGGVVFTAVAGGADPAAQEFNDSASAGGNFPAAASLETAINDAASQALISAGNAGITATADDAGGSDVVTLTASVRGSGGNLALASSNGVRLAVSGATLTYTAPAAASQQFDTFAEAGGDNATAASLEAAVNHAASQALITAAIGGGVTITAADAANVVTLTLSSVGSADLAAATLASSTGVRLAVSGAYLALSGSIPTAAEYADAAADIIARVDAGSTMTLTAVNAVLTASFGGISTELTNAGGSQSAGVLTELLDILAGRGFYVEKGETIYSDLNAYVWAGGSAVGSFTSDSTVYDSRMVMGELAPNAIGGDTESRERKPVRSTHDSTYFQASLQAGHLYQLQNGVTLFPDSDVVPFHRSLFQKENQAEVTGRIVTVYNDDGTLA